MLVLTPASRHETDARPNPNPRANPSQLTPLGTALRPRSNRRRPNAPMTRDHLRSRTMPQRPIMARWRNSGPAPTSMVNRRPARGDFRRSYFGPGLDSRGSRRGPCAADERGTTRERHGPKCAAVSGPTAITKAWARPMPAGRRLGPRSAHPRPSFRPEYRSLRRNVRWRQERDVRSAPHRGPPYPPAARATLRDRLRDD